MGKVVVERPTSCEVGPVGPLASASELLADEVPGYPGLVGSTFRTAGTSENDDLDNYARVVPSLISAFFLVFGVLQGVFHLALFSGFPVKKGQNARGGVALCNFLLFAFAKSYICGCQGTFWGSGAGTTRSKKLQKCDVQGGPLRTNRLIWPKSE